jgi:hypothetical protein
MHSNHCDHLHQHHRRHGGLFFGGLLVFAGIGALLLQYGLLRGLALWQLWPVALGWGGFLKLVRPGHWGRRVVGLATSASYPGTGAQSGRS